MKPLEQNDRIKILQRYNGLGSEGVSAEGSLSEQITNAALKYSANAPMVDAMLSELGLVKQGEGLEQLLGGLRNKHCNAPARKPMVRRSHSTLSWPLIWLSLKNPTANDNE